MAYKVLGDGLLAALTGLTRQAFHKARKADAKDPLASLNPETSSPKTYGTFCRALRRKLDVAKPGQTVSPALRKTAMLAYVDRAKVICSDLKKSHKVQDESKTAQELAALLGVDFEAKDTVLRVLAKFLKVLNKQLTVLIQNNTTYWDFGLLTLTTKQRVNLRKHAFQPGWNNPDVWLE